MAEESAHAHHERWDGSGSARPLWRRPSRSRANVALADLRRRWTHDRPYKQGIAPEQAREIVESERSHHFDPQVVDAFLRVFPNLPAALA